MHRKISLLLPLILLVTLPRLKAQITAYPDTSICPGDTITLGTTLVDYCGDCYTYEEIDYAPEDVGGDDITMVDDTHAGPFDIGFDFCFFGETYDEFYVCSNGWISFLAPTGGMDVNWTPDGPIPDAAGNVPKAAVFGPWTDWHTGLCTECVHRETIGVATNRRLVVTWEDVPLFLCTDFHGTFQIVLHETTNYIENHLTSVDVCDTWDVSQGTQGLQNEDGSIAFAVAGRNATNWDTEEESWRWYTSIVEWYDEEGTLIGEGPTVDVAPDSTSVFTVIQTLCDGTTYTDDVTIEVGADFDVDLEWTDIACGGDDNGTANIDITGGLPPYTYEWSTGETGVTGIEDLDGGSYSVTVTEAGGCSRTYNFTVAEPEELTGDATDIVNNPCFDYEEGEATIIVDGGEIPYSYSLDGGATTLLNNFNGLPAGDYVVTVTDANGCTLDVPFTITEPPLLTVDASGDGNIFVGQTSTISLDISLPDVSTITWEPEVPCAPEPCYSVTVSPTTTTTYIITVVNEEGCVATDTFTVYVEFVPEVFFPSAFSPNGDHVNDIFTGIGYNITSYDLKIFNRWGEMIFETDTYDPAKGWDGKYNNEEQEVGTYVWQVAVNFTDGQQYIDSGNFTLVR